MGKLGNIVLCIAVLASVMLCGCESVSTYVKGLIGDSKEQGEPVVMPEWFDGPRIRPGVALVVQVSTIAQPPTTMQVLVDQNGDITLPLLLQEPVACNGLKLDALKQKLVKAYSVYYKQPQITVTFAPFDAKSGGVSPWGTVTVLGEVAQPGPVNMPSTQDLTVTKVIQASGGFRPFADKRRVRVSRCDKDGNRTQTNVDIEAIGKQGRIEMDMLLKAGDVVWVPETWY
ncbi:MAG: hypothetical protein E7049_01760 [Lentisphaerae bacterium]|nr:hypothetical protein [Lentisphaerota bacterium]